MKGVDLGLLEALVVLVEEEHVSRAAARLSVTQSAMSYSLGRLREITGDEVLVRSGGEMIATTRAREMVNNLAEPLGALRRELSRRDTFVPEEAKPHFRIAASGYASSVILPRLMRAMLERSPMCTVEIVPTSAIETRERLEQARIDLAIGFWPGASDNLMTRTLFDERLCVVAGAGWHGPDTLSTDDLKSTGFAAYTSGEGVLVNYEVALNEAISRIGVKRRIAYRSPNMQTIPSLLTIVPLVAALPVRAADAFRRTVKLRLLDCPLTLPVFPVQAAWHRRSHEDAAHRWLRSELDKVARFHRLRGGPESPEKHRVDPVEDGRQISD